MGKELQNNLSCKFCLELYIPIGPLLDFVFQHKPWLVWKYLGHGQYMVSRGSFYLYTIDVHVALEVLAASHTSLGRSTKFL